MRPTLLIPIAASVYQVFAALSVFEARDNFIRSLVRSRQSVIIDPNQVPTQCQSQCAGITNLQGCSDYVCLCNEKVNQGMVACMNCILTVDGPPDPQVADALQLSLSEFENACKSLAEPLSSLTLTSVDGTPTLPAGISTPLATPSLTAGSGNAATSGTSSPSGNASPSSKSGGAISVLVPVSTLAVVGLMGGMTFATGLW